MRVLLAKYDRRKKETGLRKKKKPHIQISTDAKRGGTRASWLVAWEQNREGLDSFLKDGEGKKETGQGGSGGETIQALKTGGEGAFSNGRATIVGGPARRKQRVGLHRDK